MINRIKQFQKETVFSLKLCDRRIPFLHRHRLAEMDGCSMAVVFRNLNGCNPHCGAYSLSIDLRSDEISATGGHRIFAQIKIWTTAQKLKT